MKLYATVSKIIRPGPGRYQKKFTANTILAVNNRTDEHGIWFVSNFYKSHRSIVKYYHKIKHSNRVFHEIKSLQRYSSITIKCENTLTSC